MLLVLLPNAASWSQTPSQYLNAVCVGDTGVVYKVQGSEGSTFQWEVEGGRIVLDWGDSVAVSWGSRPGEYTIRVQEFSRYGCPAVPVTAEVYVSGPEIELGADLEICEGESIEIDPEGSYESLIWHDGSRSPVYTGDSEGMIKVVAEDDFGCQASDSLYLTVHPLPFVDLGRDTSLCGTETMTLSAGGDGILYNWSTGDTYNELTIGAGEGTIWVEVMDENSCVSYDTINIESCPADERFRGMPTAFTPNNDGKNDLWRIPQLEPFPVAVVEIYDRWGQLVFRSEPGYSNPWDGVSNQGKEMPMDSYYFIIDLGDETAETVSGTVTLIR